MFSLRSIFFRPKKSEYPLAKFFYADLELRRITTDLDSFDGSKEPVRCQKLIERLRKTQQAVMEVLWVIVRTCVHEETRASRQYRDKFPEELRGDHMSGPLWFGAECLAAGSSVLHHEDESDELRPLARHITKVMETIRTKLREQCLRDVMVYPEDLVDALRWFDYNWAEFEFSYVSRMCPVKTTEELYQQHLVTILFSETTAQALKDKLISEEQMSSYDPVLMLAIPRLSILSGLELEDGILDLTQEFDKIPTYFRPHLYILSDIKQSLSTLTPEDKDSLKFCLAASLDPHQLHADKASDNLQCLYLAISSIADQMISNHAKDLRQMLHHTFKMNQPLSQSDDIIIVPKTDKIHEISTAMECIEPSTSEDISETGELRHDVLEAIPRHRHGVLDDDNCTHGNSCTHGNNINSHVRQEPPVWVPDNHVTKCSLCEENFTLLKRKHHCRYCGQIFCCNCTSKSAVLSFTKGKQPVRVCDICYKQHQILLQRQLEQSEQSSANANS